MGPQESYLHTLEIQVWRRKSFSIRLAVRNERQWHCKVGANRPCAVGIRLESEATHKLKPQLCQWSPYREMLPHTRNLESNRRPPVLIWNTKSFYIWREIPMNYISGRLSIMHEQKIYSPVFQN